MFKKVLFLGLLMLISVSAVACGSDDTPDPTIVPTDPTVVPTDPTVVPTDPTVIPNTYTVIFQSNGGSSVSSQTITEGDLVQEPNNPTRTGYIFAGWFLDAALTTPYNFASIPSGNLTLYAKWQLPPDTTAPILFGIATAYVNLGETFDERAGVTAVDNIDGNITAQIVITGTVDVDVVGIYVLTYTITDQAGNVTSQERQVVVREEPTSELFITNGDFSLPLTGSWTHWAGEGGASTVAIVDGVLEYNITANGSQWWSSQFSQPNLTIPQGKAFRFSFEARADTPRAIVTKLENAAYVGYFDEAHMLTTEWETYEIEFYVTAATITNGKLIFGGGTTASYIADGNALTKVYLDNVKFEEIEVSTDDVAPVISGANDIIIDLNQTFNPLAGITVSDNIDINLTVNDILVTGTVNTAVPGEYELTYTVADASGNETSVTRIVTVADGLAPSTFTVVNGDFEVDQLTPYAQPAVDGWGWHGTGGTFTVMIKDGIATIDITNIGTVAHGVQFYQQNRIIEQGRVYRITFEARADIARPIMVALEQGTSRRFDQIVDITTEWESYEIIIDHILPGYTNGKFAFFMGLVGSSSVPTTVYLDNIVIERIEAAVDTVAPVLYGVDDYIIRKGIDFDPLLNVSIYDVFDKDLTLDDINVVSNLDVNVVGEYQITYTIEDASGNEAIYERTIFVKEAEDMPENFFTVLNGDFEVDQTVPYAQPAVDGWGWHGGGTFTVTIAEGIMTQVITNVGTVPHGTQFYQQNRIIDTQAMYLLTFRARVEDARSIRLSLEAGTTVNWFEIVDITTEWATYETFITIPSGGFTNGKFAFFAGLVESDSPATTFYLDDVTLELVGYLVDETAPIILGIDDVELIAGLEFEPLVGISVFDVVDKSLTPQDIVITGTVDIFEPGTYQVVYELTDRSGNTFEAVREVTVVPGEGLPSTFVVVNGDFEIDQLTPYGQPATQGWGWHGSGSFDTFIQDGVANIVVFDTWTQFFGTQFYMQNREIRQGHTYRITFMARADDPRPLRMSLEPGASGWNAFFDLTEEWVTYTFEFTHTAATITNGKFAFFAGNMHGFSTPTTIQLDNIVIERIEELSPDTEAPQIWNALDTVWTVGHEFDPMYGVQVYDHIDKTLLVEDIAVTGSVDHEVIGDYTLTYTISDASGNTVNHQRVVHVVAAENVVLSRINFIDGDFEAQSTITALDNNPGWTLKAGTGTGTWNPHEFVDGALKIDVTFVGTVPHSIQFFQRNGFHSELGQTYLVTFRARADVARDIRVSFEETTNWTVLDFEIVALTTEWATYHVYITNQNRSHADVKIGFFLGLIEGDKPERSAATAIYFDDVEITLIGHAVDETAPMIYGADVEIVQNATFNPMTGIKYGDYAKNPTIIISSETAGLVTLVEGVYTVDTSTVGTYTLTYTVTDFYGNVTEFDRELVIVAETLE